MKRKSILLVLMAFMSIGLFGQTTKYDKDYKYDLFSNLEMGVAGIYSHSLESQVNNIGAEFRLTKRIGKNYRVRGIASVNGFGKVEGFDRYGRGTIGLSADFLPFYLFIDEGVTFNPSEASKFGLALDAGAGLQFKLGSTARLFFEGGITRDNNGNKWQSNTFGVGGVSFDLGITPDDEKGLSIKKNQPIIINELKEENTRLKQEAKDNQNANQQLQSTLERATLLCEQFEQKLKECNESKKESIPEMIIYFEFASCEIPDREVANVYKYAKAMKESGKYYQIEGYSSNDGKDETNQILSENRARALMWMLYDLGVDESKMIVVGYGKTEKFGGHANLNQCAMIKELN